MGVFYLCLHLVLILLIGLHVLLSLISITWPPEASLGLFIPLVYPIQGEAVEQRGILVVWAHLDKLAFPILVGLMEDREDRPSSNPVQTHPQATSRVFSFEQEEKNVH